MTTSLAKKSIASANRFNLPTLAGDPPTIRVFRTFEYPQPSSGVNRRPLIFSIDSVEKLKNVELRPPNLNKIKTLFHHVNHWSKQN